MKFIKELTASVAAMLFGAFALIVTLFSKMIYEYIGAQGMLIMVSVVMIIVHLAFYYDLKRAKEALKKVQE